MSGLYAHENGHLLGANHDRDASILFPSSQPYAYAYTNPQQLWRTIMSYNTACNNVGVSCMILPYWSNPDILFDGVPMGVPAGEENAADNHLAINNSAATISGYRTSVQETSSSRKLPIAVNMLLLKGSQ
jgi:hypothetical protein